jgi:hypothetical protein
MEKVSIYVQKLLALALSTAIFLLPFTGLIASASPLIALIPAAAFLLFAYLDYRITGEKPRFLFGLNQSDTFLNKKGGFWNLFKWIVNLLGLLYDLVVWTLWGVFLLFVLFAELLLLIKTIAYWIIHAVIWFIRQLFPPFIFIFKMFMHYIVNWIWWIYQLTVRNMKTTINKNFYFIALWGTIPALFIVFLFFAIGQVVGIPQLVVVSAVFAIVPLVWSYGEISALRFEQREKEGYGAVRASFRNGFEAVRAVLFYLLIALVLIIAEIVLNLLGWIPNLSMSLLGITLNINMALSLLLVFTAVIIGFAGSILPTHILYRPEHVNDLNSSLNFLQVIGRKFLRYSFAGIPASFFGSLLLAIPVAVMLITFNITENVKDGVLDVRIQQLKEKSADMESLDMYRTDVQIRRLEMYKEIPQTTPVLFGNLRDASKRNRLANELTEARQVLATRRANFEKELTAVNAEIDAARAAGAQNNGMLNELSSRRLDLEEEFLNWEAQQKSCIATTAVDLQEEKRIRGQLPVLYLFIGILFAVFGGIVLAVYTAYLGNVWFELYDLREDGKPSYWVETLNDIRTKYPNHPLLGFTFLAGIGVLVWVLVGLF